MNTEIKPDEEYGIYQFLILKAMDRLPVKNEKGIYVFSNRKNEAIYVGWASFMKMQILRHIEGNSKETGHMKNFLKELYKIEIYYEETVRNIFDAYSEDSPPESLLIKLGKTAGKKMHVHAILQ